MEQPEAGEQSNELRPEESPAEGPDQQGVGAAPDKQQVSYLQLGNKHKFCKETGNNFSFWLLYKIFSHLQKVC